MEATQTTQVTNKERIEYALMLLGFIAAIVFVSNII